MTKVSLAALESRIRRALDKDGEHLRISRRENGLGIHVVDTQTSSVVAHGCTIQGLAAEMGLIKAGEELEAA